MKKQAYTFGQGLRDGLPIGFGYLSVSFGFGLSVVAAGLPALVALIISMANETSAGQLAGLTIMLASGTLLEMALTQLVINIRYSLMAISLSQRLDQSFSTPWRLLLSFSITDEIFAVASTKEKRVGVHYFAGLSTAPYVGWALGTLLGALAGTLLPDIVRNALGLILYGMFISIIIPPARRERGVLFAVCLSIGLSCILYYVPLFDAISGGFALIISSVIAAAAAAYFFPVATPAETPAETPTEEVSAHD